MPRNDAEVVSAARALAIAIGVGLHDHMLGIATYRAHPAESEYEHGHQDAIVTFAQEKVAAWIPLHDALREALARYDDGEV